MKKKFLATSAFAMLLVASGAIGSILQTAGNFTVLGGTAITSSGTVGTIIKNGNVGLSPAATTGITGFPPAVIQNGAIIATGAVTAKARQDLIKAQTGIAAMPSNANLSNTDLGGQTLIPGVYTFNANANQTGTLVLDGQGKNNVFWVFQIGTSLTTAINATITIINPGSNGGSDYGIFWNCGTAINIGADNQIAGIYLSGTSIVFGGNSTRGGRALALAGVTLDKNDIDALGGPGGSDYSGGLMYDANGNVVPSTAATAAANLSFRYFGKRKRIVHTAVRTIKGNATNAVAIQWRLRGPKWHSVRVLANDSWKLKVRRIVEGRNKLRLRVLSADGSASPIKKLMLVRR